MIGWEGPTPRVHRWARRGVAGTVVATCALAASVTVAAARSDGPRFSPAAVVVEAGSGAVPTATPEPDPQPRPARTVEPTGARESLAVTISGGDLDVGPDTVVVTLVADSDGVLRGSIEDVRVVDARGTLVGWQLLASTDGVLTTPGGRRLDAHKVFVRDASVAPVDGQDAGLQAWSRRRIDRHGAAVARAKRHYGGGTYRVDLELEVDVTPPKNQQEPSTATLVLDLSFAGR
jgi:hypothetical protein